uniref:RNA-binding protein 42 n=1 Tax=Trichogramma kaykai TaxID=54128 RepID=A0ABD2WNF1_9HYME
MDKLRQMEDEMSRFEAEIGGPLVSHMTRPVIGANTYNQVARQLEQHEIPAANMRYPPMMGFPPPPPPPTDLMMIPAQVARQGPSTYSSPAQINTPVVEPILTAMPKSYLPNISPQTTPIIRRDILEKMIHTKKPDDDGKKNPKVKGVSTAAELAISQGKASSIMANANAEESHSMKKGKKNKKIIRTAGGQTWEDASLLDWDDDDFRIFCGDLGNDVTDEMLVRVFSKYSSFQKAKVVRDKRTNKTKGFGFVSFKDPQDFIKAMKEVNGKYVGSRPIKLRKSSWKARNLDTVRRKEKDKQALIGLLTGK